MPMPVITRTSGADSAAISRATMTGSTMTENIASALSTTSPAATMTRNRHDQAAARSSPHGTCARLKLEDPAPTVDGHRGALAAHRGTRLGQALAEVAEPRLVLLAAPVWGWAPRARVARAQASGPGAPSDAPHRVVLRAYAASGWSSASSPIAARAYSVSTTTRGARGSCQPPSTSGPVLPASTRPATPGRPLRSTPPDPTSRSTSRRSLPVRSTTRPSGLTTTRLRPACRRSAVPTAARAIASSTSASASSSGRYAGSARRRSAASARSSRPASAHGADRRPAHPEVALDGAGHRGGRDDLAGEPALGQRRVRVDLHHGVHVGGGAADVDHDDVARPWSAAESARQHLDPGEHHVRRRASDHGQEVGTAAQVLAADHVGEEHLADRGPGAVRREHADPRHDVVGDDVGDAGSARTAVTSTRASTLPATTTGPRQPAATEPPRPLEQRLGVAAVGAAGQQHDVRSGRPPEPRQARSRHRVARGRRPPCRRSTAQPGGPPRRSPAPRCRPPRSAARRRRWSRPAPRRRPRGGPARPGRPGRRRTRRARRCRSSCGARPRRRSGPRPGRPARPW